MLVPRTLPYQNALQRFASCLAACQEHEAPSDVCVQLCAERNSLNDNGACAGGESQTSGWLQHCLQHGIEARGGIFKCSRQLILIQHVLVVLAQRAVLLRHPGCGLRTHFTTCLCNHGIYNSHSVWYQRT